MATAASAAQSSLSERKRHAIQAAGTAIFLERGYEAASMDLIAAEAKVSKQTIYNHFNSKDELFKEIITDMTTALLVPLSMSKAAGSTPQQLLHSFARELLELMLRPSSLAMYRLVVAESARFPELGADIYAAGAGRLIRMLADYLERETKQGRLAVEEPERAAELLIGMLTGRLQFRALLGDARSLTEEELEKRANLAVTSFLALFAPDRREPVLRSLEGGSAGKG